MITGDILGNRQECLHAFAMVREAIAWIDRTLPLSARFPNGSIQREDRLPVPAEALREEILNAVIPRDVGQATSYVAITAFDDRVEVRSVGDFPTSFAPRCSRRITRRSCATRSSREHAIGPVRSRSGVAARTA